MFLNICSGLRFIGIGGGRPHFAKTPNMDQYKRRPAPAAAPLGAGRRPDYAAAAGPSRAAAAATRQPDYADYAGAGVDLLRRVNLAGGAGGKYENANPIFVDPRTGGTLYVGNHVIAGSRDELRAKGITRIVFCQDNDGKMHFRGDPTIQYLPFAIGRWTPRQTPRPDDVLAFFAPLFGFVDAELGAGRGVLIHCLAGAHRAGTAGTACLMHLCGLRAPEAIATAKAARPVFDPIYDFKQLLEMLDGALHGQAAAVRR